MHQSCHLDGCSREKEFRFERSWYALADEVLMLSCGLLARERPDGGRGAASNTLSLSAAFTPNDRVERTRMGVATMCKAICLETSLLRVRRSAFSQDGRVE